MATTISFRIAKLPSYFTCLFRAYLLNKKHLENVGPIRYCEPFYIVIHQVSLAATVAGSLRIDVHDDDDDDNDDNDNDNA